MHRTLRSRRSAAATALVLATVLGLQMGFAPSHAAPTASTSAAVVSGPWAVLESLEVEDEPSPRAGYDRDLFRHWSDLDRDGCDTREEVLIEESLTDGTVDAQCRIIEGGTWTSLFDGVTGITNPSSLDIDHLVPLAEAWDSGADAWGADVREAFANDLEHPYSLIAVTASSNRSKGDKDPAEWRPPAVGYHCQYATDWVSVKADWGLSVDAAEREALLEMLESCETPTTSSSSTTSTTSSSTTSSTSPTTTSTTSTSTSTVPTTTSTTTAPSTSTTSTTAVPADTDNDGVPDEDEPGDANNDGVADAEQAHVTHAAGHVIVVTTEAPILVAEPTVPVQEPAAAAEFPLGFVTVTVAGQGPHQVQFLHRQGRVPVGVWIYDSESGWVIQGQGVAAAAAVRANSAADSMSVTVEIEDHGVGDITGGDGDASLQALGVAFEDSPVPPGGDTTTSTTAEVPAGDEDVSTSSTTPSSVKPGDAGSGELAGTRTPNPSSQLPDTGATTIPLTAAGIGAVLLGIVLVASTARTRPVVDTGELQPEPASRHLIVLVAALTVAEALALTVWL